MSDLSLKSQQEFKDDARAFFVPVARAIMRLSAEFDAATGKISSASLEQRNILDEMLMHAALEEISYIILNQRNNNIFYSTASLSFSQPGTIQRTPVLKFEEVLSPDMNAQKRDVFLAGVIAKLIEVQKRVDHQAGEGLLLARRYGHIVRQVLDTEAYKYNANPNLDPPAAPSPKIY